MLLGHENKGFQDKQLTFYKLYRSYFRSFIILTRFFSLKGVYFVSCDRFRKSKLTMSLKGNRYCYVTGCTWKATVD